MGAVREKVTKGALPSRRAQTRDLAVVRGGGQVNRIAGLIRERGRLLAWTGMAAVLAFGGIAFARSSAFALNAVEVTGCEKLTPAEVERAVRQNMQGTVLTMSPADIRKNLETVTRIRRATVTRVLPDMVRVAVEERKPVVLARIEGRSEMAWLDEDGVVLGNYDPQTDGIPSAIAIGFAPDQVEAGREENRQRIKVYKNLMWALDSAEPKLAGRLESVDLSHPDDARVQLTGTRVVIQLGAEDYRARLVQALDVVDALQKNDSVALNRLQITDPRLIEKASRLVFVSAVNPSQISLRFDGEGATSEARPAARPATAGSGTPRVARGNAGSRPSSAPSRTGRR